MTFEEAEAVVNDMPTENGTWYALRDALVGHPLIIEIVKAYTTEHCHRLKLGKEDSLLEEGVLDAVWYALTEEQAEELEEWVHMTFPLPESGE